MGTFWYHLQSKLQAQEGVGKFSLEALASRVLKLLTWIFGYLFKIIAFWKKHWYVSKKCCKTSQWSPCPRAKPGNPASSFNNREKESKSWAKWAQLWKPVIYLYFFQDKEAQKHWLYLTFEFLKHWMMNQIFFNAAN